MRSFCFFLVLLFAASCCLGSDLRSTNSLLEEYFDSECSITDSVTVADLTRLRALYGWLIRKCGQPIDKKLKRKALSKIASLSDILMESERVQAVIAACPVTAALVRVVKAILPQADFSDAFGTPLKMLMFEEFFKHDNPLVMNDTFDEYLIELAREVNEFHIGDFLDVEAIIFDSETGVNMSNVPSAFADSIKLFVHQYFDSIDLSIKRNLMASLVESAPGTPVERALFKIVRECGPTLQKIFQLLMDEVRNETLIDLNAQFKTGTRCMSREELFQALMSAFGTEEAFFAAFKAFDIKAVASATVAQGHLAVLHSEKQVFVKVKKFGIENQMRMDFELMSTLAQHNETYTGIYEILQQNLMAEMDWNQEVRNMEIARGIYHRPEIGIHVPKVLGTWPAEKADLIVMEKVSGEVLITFVPDSKEKACTLIRLLTDFYRIWWNEAMFDSGFMHADPHAGNVMFHWDAEEPENSKLWIIDYGNVKMLEEDVRASIMELAVGVLVGDAESIANGLGRRRYPEHEQLWNELVAGLEVFLQSPHLIPLSIDDKISQVMKHIAKQSQLPSAKDVVIFFRAKSLFDGLFKRLENEFGSKFRAFGCPVPKPNKLGAYVAVSSFKNLGISIRNAKPAIYKTFTTRLRQVPRILYSLLGKSTVNNVEGSATKVAASRSTVITSTITRDVAQQQQFRVQTLVQNELSDDSYSSYSSEQSAESQCSDSECDCQNSKRKRSSGRVNYSGSESRSESSSSYSEEENSHTFSIGSELYKNAQGQCYPLERESLRSSSSIDANSQYNLQFNLQRQTSEEDRINAFVNGSVMEEVIQPNNAQEARSVPQETDHSIPQERSSSSSQDSDNELCTSYKFFQKIASQKDESTQKQIPEPNKRQ